MEEQSKASYSPLRLSSVLSLRSLTAPVRILDRNEDPLHR